MSTNHKKMVDTNVFIEHYRKKGSTETLLYELKAKNTRIVISTITECELMAGATRESEARWNETIADCVVLPFDSRCARVAAKIH